MEGSQCVRRERVYIPFGGRGLTPSAAFSLLFRFITAPPQPRPPWEFPGPCAGPEGGVKAPGLWAWVGMGLPGSESCVSPSGLGRRWAV